MKIGNYRDMSKWELIAASLADWLTKRTYSTFGLIAALSLSVLTSHGELAIGLLFWVLFAFLDLLTSKLTSNLRLRYYLNKLHKIGVSVEDVKEQP